MDHSGLIESISSGRDWIIPLFSICLGGPLLVAFLFRVLRMIEVTSKNYYQAQLKMKMVDKGYSASEIERVVQLKPGEMGSEWEPITPAKPIRA